MQKDHAYQLPENLQQALQDTRRVVEAYIASHGDATLPERTALEYVLTDVIATLIHEGADINGVIDTAVYTAREIAGLPS